MTSDPRVEIEATEVVYQGHYRMERHVLRHRLHSGEWSRPIRREIFERGHGVVVLPYDPALDRVVLIEQFRAGALAGGLDPWLIEVPAGVIDPGESPEEVAHRELREETGLAAASLEPIGMIVPSPGASSETLRLYVARVDARAAGGIHGHPGEDEDVLAVSLPRAEAMERLARGRVVNAAAVVALQWLALNRGDLRRRWGFAP